MVSAMVTVEVQEEEFPLASVTVRVTVFAPMFVPEPGRQPQAIAAYHPLLPAA